MTEEVWKSIIRSNCVNVEEALNFCSLQGFLGALSNPKFPFVLPRRILQKIEKGNFCDPLFRQFIPLREEDNLSSGYVEDPVGDGQALCGRGVLQKYAGRVLFMTTRACAMHCRFCFRRKSSLECPTGRFVGELEYVRKKEDVEEVILSGGDPLFLSTQALADLCEKLQQISHISRLRIHSRFVIGVPERIDDALLKALSCFKRKIYFVLHVNHLQELDEDVLKALEQLKRAGISILSQTVLLRGVNDSFESLRSLFTALGNNGIIPYYLHQLDRAQGTAHFEVPIDQGLRLMEDLRGALSGYLVPRYVQEIAGDMSKRVMKEECLRT